jgi:Stage II sporulation protein E (SpoIIE)
MSGIGVAEKSEDQAFINAMPTRFASYRRSRRDMIFCHRYSTYSSHFLWRGLDPEGEMFGFPRLRALVSEHGEEERSLEETLLEELYSFVGEGWEQEDDITLLTLRRSAALS